MEREREREKDSGKKKEASRKENEQTMLRERKSRGDAGEVRKSSDVKLTSSLALLFAWQVKQDAGGFGGGDRGGSIRGLDQCQNYITRTSRQTVSVCTMDLMLTCLERISAALFIYSLSFLGYLQLQWTTW